MDINEACAVLGMSPIPQMNLSLDLKDADGTQLLKVERDYTADLSIDERQINAVLSTLPALVAYYHTLHQEVLSHVQVAKRKYERVLQLTRIEAKRHLTDTYGPRGATVDLIEAWAGTSDAVTKAQAALDVIELEANKIKAFINGLRTKEECLSQISNNMRKEMEMSRAYRTGVE